MGKTSKKETKETILLRRSPRIAAMAGSAPLTALSLLQARPKKVKKDKKAKQSKKEKQKVEPKKSKKAKKSKKEKKEVEPVVVPPKQKKKKRKREESAAPEAPKVKKSKKAVEPPTEVVPETLSAEEWRTKHEITTKGASFPDPVQRFEDCKFTKEINQEIAKAGFDTPSAIQSQCWPVAMTGKDLIAVAKTGSGKTIGFLLPGFMHIMSQITTKAVRFKEGPIMLVMAPTRELAIQIEVECKKFARSSGLVAVCVYGGVPKGPQIRQCMRGVHMIIATPGRLNDLLEMNAPPVTNLNRCSFVVLDEADRMLDMGFEPQIRSIIEQIPEHQTLMFTATWPKAVEKMARQFMKSPLQINIGSTNQLVVNKSVTQQILSVISKDKDEELKKIMSEIKDERASIIIFANRKRSCEHLSYVCRRIGWAAESIHGDKDQWQREQALGRFSGGLAKVIAATDVAARGLDIKNVTHVINYDFPGSGVEDWVHRVGRTGRAGATGIAITLFDQDTDKKSAPELVQVLTEAKQEIPDWLSELAQRMKRRGGGGGRYRRQYGRGGGRGRGRGRSRGGGRGRGRGGGRGRGRSRGGATIPFSY